MKTHKGRKGKNVAQQSLLSSTATVVWLMVVQNKLNSIKRRHEWLRVGSSLGKTTIIDI